MTESELADAQAASEARAEMIRSDPARVAEMTQPGQPLRPISAEQFGEVFLGRR